jgi:hypothetical protein
MKNIKIKKTVFEIFDKLYEYEGFQNWWDTLSDKEETEIENIVKEIIQKYIDYEKTIYRQRTKDSGFTGEVYIPK